MDALMKMLMTAAALEIGAKTEEATVEQLRSVMLKCAEQLKDAAEKAAPKWGQLMGAIKDLEKGK